MDAYCVGTVWMTGRKQLLAFTHSHIPLKHSLLFIFHPISFSVHNGITTVSGFKLLLTGKLGKKLCSRMFGSILAWWPVNNA